MSIYCLTHEIHTMIFKYLCAAELSIFSKLLNNSVFFYPLLYQKCRLTNFSSDGVVSSNVNYQNCDNYNKSTYIKSFEEWVVQAKAFINPSEYLWFENTHIKFIETFEAIDFFEVID